MNLIFSPRDMGQNTMEIFEPLIPTRASSYHAPFHRAP